MLPQVQALPKDGPGPRGPRCATKGGSPAAATGFSGAAAPCATALQLRGPGPRPTTLQAHYAHAPDHEPAVAAGLRHAPHRAANLFPLAPPLADQRQQLRILLGSPLALQAGWGGAGGGVGVVILWPGQAARWQHARPDSTASLQARRWQVCGAEANKHRLGMRGWHWGCRAAGKRGGEHVGSGNKSNQFPEPAAWQAVQPSPLGTW